MLPPCEVYMRKYLLDVARVLGAGVWLVDF